MNSIMEFTSSGRDTRCLACRHHKYVILSEMDGVGMIHTRIDMTRNKEWPYIEKAIHTWVVGSSPNEREPNLCLQSYKKIGEIK